MTVKELKEILKGCKDNDLVILSRDPEGNGYSPAYDHNYPMFYSSHSGEIYNADDPERLMCKSKKAIVLWPG